MATILWKKYKARKANAPVKMCEHMRTENLTPGDEDFKLTKESVQPSGQKSETQEIDAQTTGQDSQKAEVKKSKYPCATCRADQLAARRYRWKLMLGLFFPWAMQALDITIIAGALPFIASDFKELSQVNWVVTSFNLTAATFIPAWSQIANIFGRHFALQACMIIMLIGSTLTTAAPVPNGFTCLLFGRALQGIGCAGAGVLTHVVLADKVSLKENAKNNSIFALVGGLGYAIGPVVGGYLTVKSWRWCFGINIPIALLGIFFVFFVLRPELLGPQRISGVDDDEGLHGKANFATRLRTVDYGGQILFLFGMGLLVMALTWGGSYFSWADPKVIILLVLGVTLIICFVTWEVLMLPGRFLARKLPLQTPMIPIRLVWSRNCGLLMYVNFVTGMAMYAVFYFVDLYFVLVQGYPSSKAGIQLLYYTPGIGVGVYFAMYFCNIYPRKTWYPLALGTTIEAIGITCLAVAINQGNLPTIFGMLALTGAGSGLRFMPGSLHGVGYFPNHIAAIMGLTGLCISSGGIFAMTIMFTVFNNKLSSAGISFNGGSATSSVADLGTLTPDALAYFTEHTKNAIVLAFFALSPFMWLGIFAIVNMGNVDIKKDGKGLEGAGERDFSENTVKGPYLVSLVRKRGGRQKSATVEPEV